MKRALIIAILVLGSLELANADSIFLGHFIEPRLTLFGDTMTRIQILQQDSGFAEGTVAMYKDDFVAQMKLSHFKSMLEAERGDKLAFIRDSIEVYGAVANSKGTPVGFDYGLWNTQHATADVEEPSLLLVRSQHNDWIKSEWAVYYEKHAIWLMMKDLRKESQN